MTHSVSIEPFEAIEDEWERILPSCATNTVFVTPWWQRTWWRHFGQGAEPLIMSVRTGSSLLGIAPLMHRDGVISFLGNTDLCDYGDFLATKGGEAAFYGALFDYLPALDWHTIDLRSVPQDSPTLHYVPVLAQEKGFTVEVRREDLTPVASLPSTWDDYLAGLSKKDRHELRRKLRRVEEAGVVTQTLCQTPDTLPNCMKDFFRLHKASRPDKAEFMTPARESFFVDAALELGARDQFRLGFLELDGTRVAACIGFDYLDSYLLYNSGYDPGYSRLSVGLVSKALAIKDAIQAGKRSFNFLRGTERYKYSLGAKDLAVYQLTVRR